MHNPQTQSLFVQSLFFLPTIPEYPETSSGGIGYVIPVSGITESAQEFPHDEVGIRL